MILIQRNDIAKIVFNSVACKSIVENCVAIIGNKDASINIRDLEHCIDRSGVALEGLAIGLVFFEGVLLADGFADGPDVHGSVTLVGDDGAADSLGTGDEEGEGECIEMHFRFWFVCCCI